MFDMPREAGASVALILSPLTDSRWFDALTLPWERMTGATSEILHGTTSIA